MQQGTIHDVGFKSGLLGEIINILIYLPPSYTPLRKFPLLIAQDGKDYFQLGRVARYTDELAGNNLIEAPVIIGIPYQNAEDRRSKYHPEGEKNDAYIRFLSEELLPWAEKEYSTHEMAKARTLMGDSLAATVSLMTAVDYPHTFGNVILQSPLVNHEVLAAVRSHQAPHLLDVYHVIGKDEGKITFSPDRIEDFLSPNRELHQLFNQMGFNSFYEEFDGGHSWKYWQPDVKRALHMMFSLDR